MMSAKVFIVLAVAIALTDAACVERIPDKATDACDSKIYCNGELLKTVQLAELFNDSKTFVDLSQRNDSDVTLANFKKLMKETNNKPTREQVGQFVKENFISTGELDDWTLSDWKENPSMIKRVQELHYREWLHDLNQMWKKLARKINNDVAVHPDRHSLIYVKNGFIIPGGRFKEFYYWDSYWVIEGLLLSEMYETAKGMINNFLYMVEKYGFVPNGGRVYYLMRSQPPLLIPMVAKYLQVTRDYVYLREILPTLEKEFNYWQSEKLIEVKVKGKSYKLAHYYVRSPSPRPESYSEDYKLAQNLPEKSRSVFYNNIKAGAESGWDFSNRWCIGNIGDGMVNVSLYNISTENIIPVDLNAILQGNARDLSEFHAMIGNKEKAQYYSKIAAEYLAAIDGVLWNAEQGMWFDYDMKSSRSRKVFYPSNVAPLYTKSYDVSKAEFYGMAAVKYLKSQNVDSFFGGTPTSLNYTGEQWDFPNAWPPLQSFIVMGLYNTRSKEAMEFAKILASRWLRANYAGFAEYGKMFEKYDAVLPGQGGGGGEYAVQEGFGWTNGIIFEFLYTFPDMSLKEPDSEDDSSDDSKGKPGGKKSAESNGSNDSNELGCKESDESKNSKESGEAGDGMVPPEPKGSKEHGDSKEHKGSKEQKEPKEPKGSKEEKGSKEQKEPKEPK